MLNAIQKLKTHAALATLALTDMFAVGGADEAYHGVGTMQLARDLIVKPIYGTAQTADFETTNAMHGQTLLCTKASALTVTLDKSAPIGTIIHFFQGGAGAVTPVAESGATARLPGSTTKSNGQYSKITAEVMTNADGASAVWFVSGNLVA